MTKVFDLSGKVALITGAGGLLGPKHAEAIIEAGGQVIMTDHHLDRAEEKSQIWSRKRMCLPHGCSTPKISTRGGRFI